MHRVSSSSACWAVLAGAITLLLAGGCQSGAKITTDTEECAIDIEDGLDNIRALNQLRFNVRMGDGQTVIDEGSLTKKFRRRGVRHEVSFRPQVSGDDCDLVFYRHVERESGSRSSRSGTLASYTLESCDCEEIE